MLVSYKWLSELIDIKDVAPHALADKMSRTGIEVENVVVPQEGMKKIVVGYVAECVAHPDSDHLSICQVDVGEEELYQIVCGAPNITDGKKVIVALPGSRIAGNVKIKKGKMRGQVSLGMICSLQELGYSDSLIPKEFADGIYFLPDEAVVGEPVFPYLDMDDAIIELSITPNRADALSMRGVAYEVGAIYNRTPHFPVQSLVEDEEADITDYLTVSVADSQAALSYHMRLIKDVTIKPSPLWLQKRLMNEGMRPVNNVVDVTNYVMLLFGQPQHAFDYDKIGSQEILVRQAEQGETLTTLDGTERQLSPENILITNGSEPIGLAGVMGGLDSEITADTTTVALETAMFNPVAIRRTSKQFNLYSESSKRFEKGLNPTTITEASEFAAALIAELSGGTVVKGEIAASDYTPDKVTVGITLDKINRSLGTALTAEEVGGIFEALGFPYAEAQHRFDVTIPPRRWDITIEADIVEEVARLYGYDNLPSTLPGGDAVPGGLTVEQQLVRDIHELFQGFGYSEAISYALTTEALAARFVKEKRPLVALDWPMSEDHAVLRQNLTSSLLTDVAYNIARKNKNIALYEVGNVFVSNGSQDLPLEEKHLALALTGAKPERSWQKPSEAVDFYTIKGAVEGVFDNLGAKVTFRKSADYADLHPGRTADILIGETVIGFVGQVHPKVAKTFDIPETYVSEISLAALFAAERETIVYQEVPKFPSVKRDIALLVDKQVTHQQLLDVITGKGGKLLQTVSLFDIFEGEKLGSGKKSMAYSLVFQNPQGTLVDDDVNQIMRKIEKALTEKYEVEIR